MGRSTAGDGPTLFDRLLIATLLAVTIAFGVLTVVRSAYLAKRHTDFTVYARAGWAARTHADLYDVTDEYGLHYCYPPPFAFLMVPFAEPPSPDGGYYLRFDISVAIWYAISVACAAAGIHLIARALERTELPTATWSGEWWRRRIWPFLFALPGIGHTLSHGQVNNLLLLLVCGFLAAMMLGRARQAGYWLAGTVALKVIPAFLVIVPLVRRDVRCLAGFAVGLVVLLFGLPAIFLGPAGAIQANISFVDAMIAPALGGAKDAERALEMFHVLKTDNQSLMAVMHAWQWAGDPAAPAEPGAGLRSIHWLIAAVLTATTLGAARGRSLAGNDGLILGGSLIVVLLFISPMCHLHYYCLTVPLITGLLQRHPDDRRLWFWLGIHVIGVSIPLIWEPIRNYGFAPLGTIPLWIWGVRDLSRPAAANNVWPRLAA
ncbi:MAG: DUF2029 domain-containing protein [Gemmataceae bacterium]|nr:DUF2029 domain-containing protein [Gemmataceae bacterium]